MGFCEQFVLRLEKLDGCELLPELCKKFLYAELVSSADCFNQVLPKLAASKNAMYGARYLSRDFRGQSAEEQIDECKEQCDADIMCETFVFSDASPKTENVPRCLLTAGTPSLHGTAAWTKVEANGLLQYVGPEPKCFDRTKPYVLQRFQDFGAKLAAVTIVLGIVLVISGMV